MIFFNYLEEKIIFIIFQITFIFLNFLFSLLLGEKLLICCFISIVLILATIIYISIDFYFKRKKYLNLISLIDNTTEKYLNKEKKIIEIWSESKDNTIKLYIKDNGCGISCSDLFRVFDKGFTGTNRNKSNSTGIGLYLCKKMCNKLGLNIEIESEFSQFTLVTIIFTNTDFYKITE